MNLDTIDLDDTMLLDDPEIAEILQPRRRSRPLLLAQVQKLVEALDMGRKRHANLEANGRGTWARWKLRFSLRDSTGKITRKSVVIEDAFIAGWVREYLEQARKERSAYRCGLWEKEFRKQVAGRKVTDSYIASAIRRLYSSCKVAVPDMESGNKMVEADGS